MKVARYPAQLPVKASALVLGAFESVHIGHQALFDAARQTRMPVVALVIDNISALPKHDNLTYSSLETRLQQLANLGVNYALVVNFTPQIRELSGSFFLNEIIKLTNAKQVVVGEDFAMGQGRALKAANIKELFNSTQIINTIKFNNNRVSTTLLKELVQLGDVAVVSKLAPYPFTVQVQISEKSAFIWPSPIVQPHTGIYACYVTINDLKYPSLVRVGFKEAQVKVANTALANKKYTAIIEFVKNLRMIVKSDHDKISESDEQLATKYFQETLH